MELRRSCYLILRYRHWYISCGNSHHGGDGGFRRPIVCGSPRPCQQFTSWLCGFCEVTPWPHLLATLVKDIPTQKPPLLQRQEHLIIMLEAYMKEILLTMVTTVMTATIIALSILPKSHRTPARPTWRRASPRDRFWLGSLLAP